MKNLIILLIVFVSIFSTETMALNPAKKKLNRTNLKDIYNQDKFTDLKAVIYHISEEKSKVYVDIRLKDLKYFQIQNKNSHIARFRIFYELFQSYETRTPIDTATLNFIDTLNYSLDAEMIPDFDIPAIFPGDYILKITLTDLNRRENNTVFNLYQVSKTNKTTAQNFLVTDNENNPVFTKNIEPGQIFKIRHSNEEVKQLVVRYYNRQLAVAKTPFSIEKRSTFRFKPDSLYDVGLVEGKSELLQFPYNGIYHFQADSSVVDGLSLTRFEEGFPEVETPVLAIQTLRYLTTQKEFDALMKYPDYKIAVDSFWLQRSSGKAERAKNMIAKYYGRVVFANQMFTSYLEGWKTDKGIIYIIYGSPSEVYRKTGQEQWVYGERGNPLTINFYFDEVKNPFTDNDYYLQRSTSYKSSWYIAVENWRR
jgi:GWxTD domain-containing protein